MSKLHVAALVALAALSLPASPAFAQQIFGQGMQGVPDRAIQGRALEGDVYTCSAVPGGSRIRPNCDGAETEAARLEMQQRLKLALKPPELSAFLQCGAATTTEYRQLDTLARVSGTLEIADCAAASGAFTVAVVVKPEGGEEKPLEFREVWQRSDDQDVSFAGDYPIGENVEIVDVRLRDLTCTCANSRQEEQQEQPPAAE